MKTNYFYQILFALFISASALTAQTATSEPVVISILERSRVESIPVEKFGFVYSQQNTRKELKDFLKWVLNEGQKYNHEKGFLNLGGLPTNAD